MRYGPDDKFWVVLDPTKDSETADILFETSLRGLDLQFKGGLTMDRNPTIFTDEKKAQVEAYGRLLAMRASQAIARRCSEADLDGVSRIELLDADGNVLFEAELEDVKS